jgi:hypothetical protein
VTETARPSLVHLYTSTPGHCTRLHALQTSNLMQIPLEKRPTNQGLFVNYWTGGLQTHNFMGMVLKTHILLLMHGGRHTVIMYFPGFIIAFKDRNLHSGQEARAGLQRIFPLGDNQRYPSYPCVFSAFVEP